MFQERCHGLFRVSAAVTLGGSIFLPLGNTTTVTGILSLIAYLVFVAGFLFLPALMQYEPSDFFVSLWVQISWVLTAFIGSLSVDNSLVWFIITTFIFAVYQAGAWERRQETLSQQAPA